MAGAGTRRDYGAVPRSRDPGTSQDRSGSGGGTEETMAEAKKSNLPRLISLFIAFLGCVVVAVPIIFPLANPAPLILIGSGVTVVALGVFLFFSI